MYIKKEDLENEFKDVIKALFGKEYCDKEIEPHLIEIKKEIEKGVVEKNGNCKSVRSLLIKIRRKMIAEKYAPDCDMPNDLYSKGFKKTTEHKSIIKKCNENAENYKKLFKGEEYYEEKEGIEILNYDIDGLVYDIEDGINKKDWISENGKHFYFNELDHLLSHMVGNIASSHGIGTCEPGLEETYDKIKKEND